MTFRKGDRVEAAHKGETLYGVVVRGGKKVTMRVDGNETELKGPASLFHTSTRPLPTSTPSVMDKWGVKGYKEIEGHGDSPTFHAKITLNGKVVGEAMNDGWGGCNCYRFNDRELDSQFHADVKAWVAHFGYADMFEPDDSWVDWYVLERPYGVTADKYISGYKEKMESFSSR
jgi:hypothetical protein